MIKGIPTIIERLSMDARLLPAISLMVIFIVIDFSAIYFPFDGSIKPSFFLAFIFYFSIYMPTLIPVWLVLCVGLLTDFLSGAVPGFYTIPFVVTSWIIVKQRSFLSGQNFVMTWSIYLGVNLSLVLIQWLLVALFTSSFEIPESLIFSVIVTFAVYPLCHMALFLTHKALPHN